MTRSFTLLLLTFFSIPSYAYLGPGMSGGFIVAIAGFFGAIFLGLWGILYYPIKRSLKKRKDKKILSK
jgi:hypothetical protein